MPTPSPPPHHLLSTIISKNSPNICKSLSTTVLRRYDLNLYFSKLQRRYQLLWRNWAWKFDLTCCFPLNQNFYHPVSVLHARAIQNIGKIAILTTKWYSQRQTDIMVVASGPVKRKPKCDWFCACLKICSENCSLILLLIYIGNWFQSKGKHENSILIWDVLTIERIRLKWDKPFFLLKLLNHEKKTGYTWPSSLKVTDLRVTVVPTIGYSQFLEVWLGQAVVWNSQKIELTINGLTILC